jgi:2-amino-4-hydroxy-6-hydroxymethyldihydropteridine diphosphokinase
VEQLHLAGGVEVLAESALVESAPVGGPAGQGRFANGAALVEANHSPHELILRLQAIEQQLGRQRHERWASRTLDVDLLLYGDQVVEASGLRVPHPRMSFRPFVLSPSVQIASEMVHPLLGMSLAQLSGQLQAGADGVAIRGGSAAERRAVVDLIGALRPGINCSESGEDASGGAKLTVAVGPPGVLPDAGPTLWLPAELGEDRQRAELAAALECVWPGLG